MLEKTGLTESLEGNIWTLLAPTNKAFDKFQRKYPLLMQKLLRGDTCTASTNCILTRNWKWKTLVE